MVIDGDDGGNDQPTVVVCSGELVEKVSGLHMYTGLKISCLSRLRIQTIRIK